jgi:long-chain acyl-CoA synthetase
MNETIYGQLAASAAANPDASAVRFENRTWNYRELLKEVDRAAGKLLTLGIRKDEVVAVCMPNCPQSVFLLYAISEIGAIAYFIHPLTPPAELASFLRRASSRFVFLLNVKAKEYKASLPEGATIVSVNPYDGVSLVKALAARAAAHLGREYVRYEAIKGLHEVKPVDKDPALTGVYLNTGGTNGEPKIIELSASAINALGRKGYPLIGGEPNRIKMLTVLPLFHGFGLCMGVVTPLSAGASTSLMMKFSTLKTIELIKRGEVTAIIGVPTLYNALLNRDEFFGPWLKNLIVAFIGGDSVPPALLERWNATMIRYGSECRLYEGYGLTETVTVTNVNTKLNHKKGTVGKPLPGLEEAILDLTSRKRLGPNESGEIVVAGDTLMNDYLGDGELTKASFLEMEGKKWVLTRDYGYLDEEGYLVFKQRLRRIVKVSGIAICPSEVEKIALSYDEIYEAYAFGVPDESKGSLLRLIIVLRKGYEKVDESELKSDIYSKIKASLGVYSLPDRIIVLASLPKTPVGKIDDAAIRKLY